MMPPRLAALLTKERSKHGQLQEVAELRPPCENLGPRLWGKVQPLSDCELPHNYF